MRWAMNLLRPYTHLMRMMTIEFYLVHLRSYLQRLFFVDDVYLKTRISMPRDGKILQGKVTKRGINSDDNPVGRAIELPSLYSHRYKFEFLNSNTIRLTASAIAERMYASVDEYERLNMGRPMSAGRFVSDGSTELLLGRNYQTSRSVTQ